MTANSTHTTNTNRIKHTTSYEMLRTELANELSLNNTRDTIKRQKLLQITVNGSFKALPHSTLYFTYLLTYLLTDIVEQVQGRRCLHLERFAPSLPVFRQRLKTVLFHRSYPNICVI